jgi:short-subunit dehydrogenase
MRILLTGAFGNIGAHTLDELLRRGHQVRAFDLPTRANRKAARSLSRIPGCEVAWGDLRRPDDVARAVDGVEAVIHLAFVIPKLSATGISSEAQPDWARQINVGGTRNLIEAMRAQPTPPRLLFASSLHVYGRTYDRTPPLSADDPIDPIEHYARHKSECEQLVRGSGLTWAIYRLPATLPIRLVLDLGMFDVPLDNRIEFGHVRDVAAAFAQGLETEAVWGRLWLIGGGARCQVRYGELVSTVLDASGVGMLPAQAFTREPFPTDWLDTRESERLLHYQRRTLQDYAADLRALMGFRRHLVVALRPIVRWWLLRLSGYYRRQEAPAVALVTGGSGGIGAATARRLARAGTRVILVARGLVGLEQVAAVIHRDGGQATVLTADLSREEDCRRVFDRSTAIYGPVDLVVNCAGIGWYGYGDEMPWPAADEMIGVNVTAVARLTLLFLADMKARGRGHIINVGSIAGSLPSQGAALYSATKSFVDVLTSSLYRELKSTGVHISVLRPGAVRSRFFDKVAAASAGRRIPAERLAVSPERVAEGVWSVVRRPRRLAYVPAVLAVVPWIELAFGWLIDRLGPVALRHL